jgi:hypothetical protein
MWRVGRVLEKMDTLDQIGQGILIIGLFLLVLWILMHFFGKKIAALGKIMKRGAALELGTDAGKVSIITVVIVAALGIVSVLVAEVRLIIQTAFKLSATEQGAASLALVMFVTAFTGIINFIVLGWIGSKH